MSYLIRSSNMRATLKASVTTPRPQLVTIHHIKLAPLHDILHITKENPPEVHGVRLHAQESNSNYSISTTVPEFKIFRELREARERQAALAREMEFREAHGRVRMLRGLDIYEPPTWVAKQAKTKTTVQVIAGASIAS